MNAKVGLPMIFWAAVFREEPRKEEPRGRRRGPRWMEVTAPVHPPPEADKLWESIMQGLGGEHSLMAMLAMTSAPYHVNEMRNV